MVELVRDPLSPDVANADTQHASVRGRPLVVVGGGGFGSGVVTSVKGEHIQHYGAVPTDVRFLAFDVMPVPPTLSMTGGMNVQLEPGVEYLQLGRGCNPSLLRQRRDEGRLDPELAELVDLQPGGYFARSLEFGSENERLFGMLAFRWSRREVRRLITSAMTAIARGQRAAPDGENPSDEAPIVIVAASLAGGVGSSIALPLAAEVRRAMRSLGMNVEASTFVSAMALPETFPITRMRLSNCFDTLSDFQTVQEKGVLPS